MKKILRCTSWDNSAFTAENVADKSHWLIKLLDRGLHLMGFEQIEFLNTSTYVHVVCDDWEFNIQYPKYSNDTQYILYIDTEKREMCGCASLNTVYSTFPLNTLLNLVGNAARGYFNKTQGTFRNIGGILEVKFMPGGLTYYRSASENLVNFSSSDNNRDTRLGVGSILPKRGSTISPPIVSADLTYTRKAILTGMDDSPTISEPNFAGNYYESIFDTVDYYLGALKTEDNKLYYYDGKIFSVDNADDIEIVDTNI